MITKLFDCVLDAGYPTVRIPVSVPETAQEVLDRVSKDSIEAAAEKYAAAGLTNEERLERFHELLAVQTMRELYLKDETQWLRQNGPRLVKKPDSEPKDFASAFPSLFAESDFAKRFALADAKAEYFRLYGLHSSSAAFKVVEAAPGSPAPVGEHEGFRDLRQQEKVDTFGTERHPIALHVPEATAAK